MRRQLNVKFLIGMILVTALVGVAFYGLHAVQVKRNANAFLKEAKRSEDKGDRTRAMDYIERYLIYRPKDTDAMVWYANLLAPDPDTATPLESLRAADLYEKVITLEPNLKDARARCIDFELKFPSYYQPARRNLLVLLAASDTGMLDDDKKDTDRSQPYTEQLKQAPKNGRLKWQLGRCHELLGKYDQAVVDYREARADDPHLIDAYVHEANILRNRLGRPNDADKLMDAAQVENGLIALNATDFKAYLARARYRQALRLAGVTEDVAKAREMAPDDADVLLMSGTLAMEGPNPNPNEARKYLRRGIELHSKDVRLYEELSRIEITTENPKAAEDCLRAGIEKMTETDANRVTLQWMLADILVQNGRPKQVEQLLDELRERHFQPLLISFVEARLEVSQQKWFKAAGILERIAPQLALLPELGDNGIGKELAKRSYAMLGLAYEHLGRPDQQYDAYRRGTEIVTPSISLDVMTRLGLAAALVAQDKFNEAIEQYNKLLRLPGTPPNVLKTIAQIVLIKNLRQPDAQRDWREVDTAIAQAEKALPGSAEMSLLRAETLFARNQIDAAQQQIQEAIEQHPDLVDCYVALAAIKERQGRLEDALSILSDAEQKLGPRVEILAARARYWGGRGGSQALEALKQIQASLAQLKKDEERWRLTAALVDAYTRINKSQEASQEARQLTEQIAKDQPKNLNLQILLFEQCLRGNDLGTAEKTLSLIRQLDDETNGSGDGLVWRYCRVRLLIQQAEVQKTKSGAELAEAQQLLRLVRQRRPNWAGGLVAQARIDEMMNHTETALSDYLEAITLGDRSAFVIQRATQMLLERGRYAQADDVLRKLQSQGFVSDEMQRLSANVALNVGDYERALTEARHAMTSDTKNARDLVWYGQILWSASRQADAEGRAEEAKGRRIEAEQILRKAVATGGDTPESWVTLVQFLAGTQQLPQAQAAVQEAENRLPAEKYAVALAQCFDLIGQADRANALYQQALASQPNDPVVLRNVALHSLRKGQTDDAKTQLRQMIQAISKTGGSTADLDWARQTLAILTAVGGNYQQTLKAMEILGVTDRTKESQPHSPQILRTQAKLLALRPNRSQRRQAIEILEGLVERDSQPGDQFELARLYEADGRWSNTREIVQKLIKDHPGDPSLLAYYITTLIRHQAIDEAETYLPQLEKAAPNQPGTLATQARILAAKGHQAEAVQMLKNFAKGDEDKRLELAAALLEDLGQMDDAEVMYRTIREKFTNSRPTAVLPLVGFLSRRARTREALELLDDNVWSKLPAEVVSNACVTILYNADAPSQDWYDRIVERINRAILDNPAKTSLRFDLANVRSIQGQFQQAEEIYRAVAKEEPNNGASLNNLAWLLALESNAKLQEAVDLIQKAMGIDGETPELLDTRAIIYLAQGRPEDAIRDLEDAIAVQPTKDKFFHLARAYLAAGRRSDASESFRRASELKLVKNNLHPLERPQYERLEDELKRK